ncbi:MAG: heavy metal-associated domain-containing protein [Arenicellales bacterium]|jgi:copper chaperone CopZ|nr:heavy metal-associated domain-containing protein [Arenicellales bacterium]
MSNTVQLTIGGMGCGGCASAVENAVKLVTGVESVAVDYATQTATVEGVIDAELLIQAIEDAGYEAMIKAPSKA